ncbi:hypothetical protein [Parendozoicomonas haliclonae]|uniref:Tryptophan synthase subunit beta like protein n=1 Tax=Parendozoicomonas haliclonae TaxID=1960125 RepID=A0A1X7AIV5_9GAMM|nr:hypothetical protein [Parendozoicomonas haliclonae]SMA45850.1 hypothetical protein EHSB41UT_02009 [Parendozoicomonas haliclonae]
MLYGFRDESGNLVAIGEAQVSPEWQPIDEVSDETRAFLARQQASQIEANALQDSDLQFIRVLDDVIELLIEKQMIQFTELPQPAQDKLLKRRWYRQQLRGDDDTTHLIDPQEGLL